MSRPGYNSSCWLDAYDFGKFKMIHGPNEHETKEEGIEAFNELLQGYIGEGEEKILVRLIEIQDAINPKPNQVVRFHEVVMKETTGKSESVTLITGQKGRKLPNGDIVA